MTAAARTVTVRNEGAAARVAKALGAAGLSVFAKLAALMAPRMTQQPGHIRVTRDFGETWEEWPPEGYGVERDKGGHWPACGRCS